MPYWRFFEVVVVSMLGSACAPKVTWKGSSCTPAPAGSGLT
jgi:hypothetical protein